MFGVRGLRGLVLACLGCTGEVRKEALGESLRSGRERPEAQAAREAGAPPARAEPSAACSFGAAVETEGRRRLALLVGVGDYTSDSVPDLKGPRADVEAMRRLLTDKSAGFGFPAENVCVLLDEGATVAAFQDAFQRALIDRARPGDTVLLYFSGHGTQVRDRSQDEPDEKDEALILHDSLTKGVDVLRDDVLNGLLAALAAKTEDLTVLLDACTSGSATKGVDREKRVVLANDDTGPEPGLGGDGAYYAPSTIPGLVLLSAARDGTLALEPPDGGLGYFTAGIVDILSQPTATPLTWAQVARRLPPRIEQMSERVQLPLAQGALDRTVFGGGGGRPLGWEVVRAGDTLLLEGLGLPGWGVGAEIRLYAGGVSGAEAVDPAKARATAKITRFDGVRAEARLVGTARVAVEAGDLAVLALPAPESWRLEVALAPELPAALAKLARDTITKDAELINLVKLQEGAGYQLGVTREGALRLRGPEGVTRNVFTNDASALPDQLRRALAQHARQGALLALQGATGGVFEDNQTLELRLVPDADQPACARPGWVQSCPNERQQVPLCGRWKVQVRNTHASERLRAGGLLLSNDGAILGLPQDGTAIDLPPGGRWVDLDTGSFSAVPPFGTVEDILVFGTRPDVEIPWAVLTAENPTQPGTRDLSGALGSMFADYLTAGTRAVKRDTRGAEASFWTVSRLPFEVVANVTERPNEGAPTCDASALSREYTIQRFDVSPYVPADPTTALARVLQQAEQLTRRGETDGVPYRQHAWSKGSDRANLDYGIDCSRSIWFAFTRAGLPYTSGKWQSGFLPTSQMFDAAQGSCRAETPKESLMHEHFQSCLGQPFQTGDILVWQGKRPTTGECIGHTVMVVDPEAYIGWGSHGWDGSKDEEGARLYDTGVEYQRILSKTWAKWDRREYALKACWRHDAFIAEAERNLPVEELYLSDFSCEDPKRCWLGGGAP